MNAYDMIEKKPEAMPGKTVIEGTRIPVDFIARKLGEGASFENLHDGYPNLSREAIQATMIYAADMIHNETTIFWETGTVD